MADRYVLRVAGATGTVSRGDRIRLAGEAKALLAKGYGVTITSAEHTNAGLDIRSTNGQLSIMQFGPVRGWEQAVINLLQPTDPQETTP